MRDQFIPKINLPLSISDTKLYRYDSPMRLKAVENSPEIPSFKEVMTGMAKELDNTIKAPDQVLQNAMLGNGADIHDVMIAISKADVGVNLAVQIDTKVLQAYDKVMQIQV